MATTPTLLTAEEFAAMPWKEDGIKRELKKGRVVELGHSNFGHELIKSAILGLLIEWNLRTKKGVVFSETEYELQRYVSYIPDISFLTNEREVALDLNRLAQGAPDLAVEVVSSESAEYLEGKIEDYFAHGSRGVWVLYPEQRVIRLHARDGSSRLLREADWVEDPGVLPGFRAPVASFFAGLPTRDS
jgi:Uma2 family endonuclease